MNDDTAGAGRTTRHSTGGDDSGPGQESNRDHARLQRRAVFLSELQSARQMIARAREADRSLMIRELIGRRPIVRGL